MQCYYYICNGIYVKLFYELFVTLKVIKIFLIILFDKRRGKFYFLKIIFHCILILEEKFIINLKNVYKS